MQRTDSLEKTLMLGKVKGGEGDDRGWDGWMASPTQWTWVWASSGSWQWTGRPGVLQSLRLQRVGHKWATELKWTNLDLLLGSLSLVLTRSQEVVSATEKGLLVLKVSRRERRGLDWKLPGKIGLSRSKSNTRKNHRSREPSPTDLFLGCKDYVRTDVMYKV